MFQLVQVFDDVWVNPVEVVAVYFDPCDDDGDRWRVTVDTKGNGTRISFSDVWATMEQARRAAHDAVEAINATGYHL